MPVRRVSLRQGRRPEIHRTPTNPRSQNKLPIIAQRGVNATPPQDQYFKGALFLNTLRSIVDDDKKWFSLIREFYQKFKYQNIMTEDMVAYFNKETGKNLTPVFDQYLRHPALPVLELKFDTPGSVSYRWVADEKGVQYAGKGGNCRQLANDTTDGANGKR